MDITIKLIAVCEWSADTPVPECVKVPNWSSDAMTSCGPLQLTAIRRDVRRTAALLQQSAPEMKLRRRPLQSTSGYLHWCSRLDPDGRHRNPANNYIRAGLDNASRHADLQDEDLRSRHSHGGHSQGHHRARDRFDSDGKVLRFGRRTPRGRHYNTPDEESIREHHVLRKKAKLQSFDGKVRPSDIDHYPMNNGPPNSRDKGRDSYLPPIRDPKTGSSAPSRQNSFYRQESSGANQIHVQLPRVTDRHSGVFSKEATTASGMSIERLPAIPSALNDSCEPHMRYKHGVVPSLERKQSQKHLRCSRESSYVRFASDAYSDDGNISESELGISTTSIGWGAGICKDCKRGNGLHQDWCPRLLTAEQTRGSGEFRREVSGLLPTPRGIVSKRVSFERTKTDSSLDKYLNQLDRLDDMLNSGAFDYKHNHNISDVQNIGRFRRQLSREDTTSSGGTSTVPELRPVIKPRQSLQRRTAKGTTEITLFPDGAKQAYLKALRAAEMKRLPQEPWMYGSRISRSYVFSYYQNVPQQSDIPANRLKPATLHASINVPARGKEMKHIFGSLDINDFYPGGKHNPLSEDNLATAIVRQVKPLSNTTTKRKRKKVKAGTGAGPKAAARQISTLSDHVTTALLPTDSEDDEADG